MSQEHRGSSLNLGRISIVPRNPNNNGNMPQNLKYRHDRNPNVGQSNSQVKTNTINEKNKTPVPAPSKRLFVPDSDSDTSRPASKKLTRPLDSLRISGEENRLLSLLQSRMKINRSNSPRRQTPTKIPNNIIQNGEKRQMSSPSVPTYKSQQNQYTVANRSYTTPSNNNTKNAIKSDNIVRSDPQITGDSRAISRQASLNFQRSPSANNRMGNNNLQNLNSNSDKITSFQESMKNLLSQNYSGNKNRQNESRSIISTNNSQILYRTQVPLIPPTVQSSQPSGLTPNKNQTPNSQPTPNNGIVTDKSRSPTTQINHQKTVSSTSDGVTNIEYSSSKEKFTETKEKPPVIDLLYLNDEEGDEDEGEKEKKEEKENVNENESDKEQIQQIEMSTKEKDNLRKDESNFDSSSKSSSEHDEEDSNGKKDEERKDLEIEKNLEMENEESEEESEEMSKEVPVGNDEHGFNEKYIPIRKISTYTKEESKTQESAMTKTLINTIKLNSHKDDESIQSNTNSTQALNQTTSKISSSNKYSDNSATPITGSSQEYFYGDSQPPPERVVNTVQSGTNKDSDLKSHERYKNNASEDLPIKTPLHDHNSENPTIQVTNSISDSSPIIAFTTQEKGTNSLMNHSISTSGNTNENNVGGITIDVTNPSQGVIKSSSREILKGAQSIPKNQLDSTETLFGLNATKGNESLLFSNSLSSQNNTSTSKENITNFKENSQTSKQSGVVSKDTNTSAQLKQTSKNVAPDNENTTELNTQELALVQTSELKRKYSILEEDMLRVNGPNSKIPRFTTEKQNSSKGTELKTNMNDTTGGATSNLIQKKSQEVLFLQEPPSETNKTLHVQPDTPKLTTATHTDPATTADTDDKALNLSSQGSTSIVKLEESGNLKEGIIQNYYRPLKSRLRPINRKNKNGSRHSATLEVIYISDPDAEEGGDESDQQPNNETTSKSDSSDTEDKDESEQGEEKNQSDKKGEIGTEKVEEYDYAMNINIDGANSSDMTENKRVKLIKKFDNIMGRNLTKYLNPPQPVQKSGLLRLIDGGIIKHTPLSLNNAVSSTNDVCNRDNFESSPVLFYQRLHKKSRLAEEKLSYELTDDFYNRGANLIADVKHSEKRNEVTSSIVLSGDIQETNKTINKPNITIQQNDKTHLMNMINTSNTSLPSGKFIPNDAYVTREATSPKENVLSNEAVASNEISSPIIMQNLKEATVRDEPNISRKGNLPSNTVVDNEENVTTKTSAETNSNILKDTSIENNMKSDVAATTSSNRQNFEDNVAQKDSILTSHPSFEAKTNDVEADINTSKAINKFSSSKNETSSAEIQPDILWRDTESKGNEKKLTSREKWRNSWITNLRTCPFYPYEGYPKTALTVESRKKLDSSFEVIKNTLQEKYGSPVMPDFTQDTYIILLKGELSDFQNDKEFDKIYAIAEKAINGRKMRVWSFNKVSKFLLHMENIPDPVLDEKDEDESREQKDEKSNNLTSEIREESKYITQGTSVNNTVDVRKISNANKNDKSNKNTHETRESPQDNTKNTTVDNIPKTNVPSKDYSRKNDDDSTTMSKKTTVKSRSNRTIPDTKETFENNAKDKNSVQIPETKVTSQHNVADQNLKESGSIRTQADGSSNVGSQKVDSRVRSMSSKPGNMVVHQHSFIPLRKNAIEERASINASNIQPVPVYSDDSNIVVSQTNSQETDERGHDVYKEQENGRIITEMMTNLQDLVVELNAELKREQEANEKAHECMLELSNKLLKQEIANSRLKSSLEIEKTTKQYVEEQNLQLADALKRLKDQQKFNVYINGMRLEDRNNTDS